jgi:subtilase family serine protease
LSRNFAVSISILVSLLLISNMAMPQIYATNQGTRLDAHPYFQLNGTATSYPKGLNPDQIWNAYGFSKLNCYVTSSMGWDYANLCGHGQVIAIVDAYNDPSIESDLATFDEHWGLPECTTANGCFTKITPSGIPNDNSTWALEESLDVEWAHAIAPGAKIVLVESQSNSFRNLIHSINYTEIKTGAGQISISWGVPEFPNETSYDSYFAKSGISFFAPSGNGASHLYPAASSYVVSVGGTTLDLAANGAVQSETAWGGSSSGPSFYEPEPSYQVVYNIESNGQREIPDVSYDADPRTGFSVYDSTSYDNQTGWFIVGGTSAGVSQWAAIAAIASSQGAELSSYRFVTAGDLYTAATGTLHSSNYRYITQTGNNVNQETSGYDFTTGLGSPTSNNLVSFLSPKPTVPSVPLDLVATQHNQKISLTWQAPSFAGGLPITKYNIYRGMTSGGEMILNVVPSTNQSYTDVWLDNGATYYYYVTAINAVGESHGSNEAYAIPVGISSSPRNLVGSISGAQISLMWQPPSYDNGSSIIKYDIYRGTSSGQETLLKSISNSTTSYADVITGSDQTYYYYVTAVNAGGESASSNQISVSQPASTPSAPQNLTSTATSNQVLLRWQQPASIGGDQIIKYNIYESITPGNESFLTSVPPNVLHYTNAFLVNGETYYYYVTAVNAMGESASSNQVSGTPG